MRQELFEKDVLLFIFATGSRFSITHVSLTHWPYRAPEPKATKTIFLFPILSVACSVQTSSKPKTQMSLYILSTSQRISLLTGSFYIIIYPHTQLFLFTWHLRWLKAVIQTHQDISLVEDFWICPLLIVNLVISCGRISKWRSVSQKWWVKTHRQQLDFFDKAICKSESWTLNTSLVSETNFSR